MSVGLIEKFGEANGNVCILRCTDGLLPLRLQRYCFDNLKSKTYFQIITSTKKPQVERYLLTYYKQLLECCEETTADMVFICEHDVVYHHTHFYFVPERDDTFYYDTPVWRNSEDGWFSSDSVFLSQCVCYKKILVQALEERINCKESYGCEPGFRDPATKFKWRLFKSEYPSVDIRHGKNLTPGYSLDLHGRDFAESVRTMSLQAWSERREDFLKKFSTAYTDKGFQTVPYWGDCSEFRKNFDTVLEAA